MPFSMPSSIGCTAATLAPIGRDRPRQRSLEWVSIYLRPSPMMHDFVPLSEIVRAISNKVALPGHWEGSYLHTEGTPSRPERAMNSMFGSFMASVFRKSEAAAILDLHLRRDGACRLRWLDIGPTGKPREDLEARGEALKLLEEASNHFDRAHQAFDDGRNSRYYQNVREVLPQFRDDRSIQRFNQIGFGREDADRFLNWACIEHDFGDAPNFIVPGLFKEPVLSPPDVDELAPNTATETSTNLVPRANRGSHAYSAVDSDTGKPCSETVGVSTSQTTSPTAATPLAATLGEARTVSPQPEPISLNQRIDEAIDELGTHDTSTILRELKRMARDKLPPFKSIETIRKEEVLFYEDRNESIKQLTRKLLDNRLRGRWEALGMAGPRTKKSR